MGKRKHKEKRKSHSHRKRRRYDSDSCSTSPREEYYEDERYRNYRDESRSRRSHSRRRSYTPESDYNEIPIYDSDNSIIECENRPRSVVSNKEPGQLITPQTVTEELQPLLSTTQADGATPSTSAETTTLPLDILEALGDPKGTEEVLGPKIPDEIAKRWGRILVNGLTKEQKQDLTDKTLIPENFRLAKAPMLNPEIIPVLSEASRHRDKLLEKSQNQLGLGISKLTNLASMVIEGKMDKIDILKQVSEASQIFLDLHHEDTKRRRRLVTASLDKKFLNMITDVKRDDFLFGVNLGEKIKTSKTAERSGLQIKRSDAMPLLKKYPHQGNWRGPPRAQAQRARGQGGHRNRYWASASRRPPPPPDRRPRPPPPPARTSASAAHKTQ